MRSNARFSANRGDTQVYTCSNSYTLIFDSQRSIELDYQNSSPSTSPSNKTDFTRTDHLNFWTFIPEFGGRAFPLTFLKFHKILTPIFAFYFIGKFNQPQLTAGLGIGTQKISPFKFPPNFL
jgi:hypothetical protein